MSTTRKYDVVALTAACVDYNMKADDAFLQAHGIEKGQSTVVNQQTLAEIIENGQDITTKTSGSPGANVANGISLRGGTSALIGKVTSDDDGIFFTERVQANDVEYTPLLCTDASVSTTKVVVMVTPDKERSFAFHGDAGLHLMPEDIDQTLLAQAKIVYLDSFLWLSQIGREAVFAAAEKAAAAGALIAVSLNSGNLIERHREEYLKLVETYADIVMGDRREFAKLLGTDPDNIEGTLEAIQKYDFTASITAGSKEVFVVENGTIFRVATQKIKLENIVDTCGAGDAFASGFLYGLSQGKSAEDSAVIGTKWAADIIQHEGAEPQIGKNAPAAKAARKLVP